MSDAMSLSRRADALEAKMAQELDYIVVKSRLHMLAEADLGSPPNAGALMKANPNAQVDGVLAANDAMALGAIDAFKEAKKPLPPITGINAGKEAVDMIKAGDMLASGDYNGLIDGCLGAEIAIRALRKQESPKEIMAKTQVVDKSNLAQYEIPVERRPCPTLASMTAK